jgi:hypothetical protein
MRREAKARKALGESTDPRAADLCAAADSGQITAVTALNSLRSKKR